MVDVFSKEKRSEIMRSIKNRGTGIEIDTAEMLRRAEIRYEPHPKVYGSPDFLVEGRLALFCDGSFWHGRNWFELKKRLLAGNNPEYWVRHIGDNRKRDRKVVRTLEERGFQVLRLWDTDVKKRPAWCVERIRKTLGDSGRADVSKDEGATARTCLQASARRDGDYGDGQE